MLIINNIIFGSIQRRRKMNTGIKIETERLMLIPGSNVRDNVPFIHMLRSDGNFCDFCGIEFSEKYLAEFSDYFERTGHEECIYSIFPKGTDEFIGYVGFHRERNSDYEIEFYISKLQRRKGYCEEACKAVIELIFSEGLSVDDNVLSVQKLYATTLAENIAVNNLLSKLGFKKDIPKDGPVLVMEGFVDEETDEFFGYFVSKYVMEKE